MRFSKTLGLIAAIVAAASFTACKGSTAEGNAGPGSSGAGMSADGGMGMSADGGSMGGAMGSAAGDMGAAAGQAGHDMKQGAESAGHDMAAGANSAAAGAADAGMQAADAAGSASTTASNAAGDMKHGADAAAAEPAKPAGPTDPQIAAIVVAANTVDIDAAKLAMKHSKDAKVKKFAKDMVRDHTANNKAAVALVTKLGVTPEENDTSKSLTDGGKKNTDNLKTLKGKDFDKAYVDNEVTYHQSVIDAIDNTLIPSAKNEELKALLTKTSPVIKEHLEHAKMVQSSMSGAK